LLRGQAIGEVKQISPKIFGGVVDAAQKTVAKAREVARQAVSRAGMSRSKGDVMSDEVSRFRVNVHEKLETLQSRMGSLELNSGTTWHLLQEKLDEMRHRDKARQSAVADARARLERWSRDNESEETGMIDQWVGDHETRKLAARARQAEESVGIAIMLAEASIDDVERMVLEAIAARREADAATSG